MYISSLKLCFEISSFEKFIDNIQALLYEKYGIPGPSIHLQTLMFHRTCSFAGTDNQMETSR